MSRSTWNRSSRRKKRSKNNTEGPFSLSHFIQNGSSDKSWNSVFSDIIQNWKRKNKQNTIPDDVKYIIRLYIHSNYGLITNSCMTSSTKWIISDPKLIVNEMFDTNGTQFRYKSEKFECAKLKWQLKLFSQKEYNYKRDHEDTCIIFRLELLSFPSSIDSITVAVEFRCLESEVCFKTIQTLNQTSNLNVQWLPSSQNTLELKYLYFGLPGDTKDEKLSVISENVDDKIASIPRVKSLDDDTVTPAANTTQFTVVSYGTTNNNNNNNNTSSTNSFGGSFNTNNTSSGFGSNTSGFGGNTSSYGIIQNNSSSFGSSNTWGSGSTNNPPMDNDDFISSSMRNYLRQLKKIYQLTFICNMKILRIRNRFHCEFEYPYINKMLSTLTENKKMDEIEEKQSKNIEIIEWNIDNELLSKMVNSDTGKVYCSQNSKSQMWHLMCFPNDTDCQNYVKLALCLNILPPTIDKIKVNFKLLCLATDTYTSQICEFSYDDHKEYWAEESLHISQLKAFEDITLVDIQFRCEIEIIGITDIHHIYKSIVSEEDSWLSYIQQTKKEADQQLKVPMKVVEEEKKDGISGLYFIKETVFDLHFKNIENHVEIGHVFGMDNKSIIHLIVHHWKSNGVYGVPDDDTHEMIECIIDYIGNNFGIECNSMMQTSILWTVADKDMKIINSLPMDTLDIVSSLFNFEPKSNEFECGKLKFCLNLYPYNTRLSLHLLNYPSIINCLIIDMQLFCIETKTHQRFIRYFNEREFEHGWTLHSYLEVMQALNANHLTFGCDMKILRIIDGDNNLLYDHPQQLSIQSIHENNKYEMQWNDVSSEVLLSLIKEEENFQTLSNYRFMDGCSMFHLVCIRPPNFRMQGGRNRGFFGYDRKIKIKTNSVNSVMICVGVNYLPMNVSSMRVRCRLKCVENDKIYNNLLVFSYADGFQNHMCLNFSEEEIKAYETFNFVSELEIIDVNYGGTDVVENINLNQKKWVQYLKNMNGNDNCGQKSASASGVNGSSKELWNMMKDMNLKLIDMEMKISKYETGDDVVGVNEEQKISEFDLETWLKVTVGLPQYLDMFLKHEIKDIEILQYMNDERLKQDLEINTLGHRIKILVEIEKLLCGLYEKQMSIQSKEA